MAKSLVRDLRLYAVFTISLGAMIGSGIFVLPGLAAEIAGPAVILAYLLAGLIVLPAALSKAEMATAMPEAGGTYLYIDRAMGPMMGTIAGFGVWFQLVFKSAFALVGLGAYLALFSDLPATTVALAIAVVLVVLNILGVKQSGRFQAVIVSVVLIALVAFVGTGAFELRASSYQPFLPAGIKGLLSATGVVFVSYAGVTKVASVAEEIQDPGRNIPVGILSSILLMMVLYPVIVLVVVGVTPPPVLESTLTPLTAAGEQFLGSVAIDLVAMVAVLALVSMANAGLLASSRYPFAMSRNSLAPSFLRHISDRSGTPVVSIGLTGVFMVLLVAFVPLLELAKLASAFQLLVFSLVNLALIAFREAGLDWYRPQFRSPAYPWVQILGILGAVIVLTQMGWHSVVGALGIVAVGLGWYQIFGKSRASRESASLDALRIRSTSRLVATTEEALAGDGKAHILIPVRRQILPDRMRDLVRLSRQFAGPHAHIQIVRFQEVPDQLALAAAAHEGIEEDSRFVEEAEALARSLGVDAYAGTTVSHDRKRAIVDYARNGDVDLVLAEMPQELRTSARFNRDLRWVRDHALCDTIYLRNRNLDTIDSIVIMGSGGPYDVLKIGLAHRIGKAEGARIRFVHVVNESATDAQLETIRAYHAELDELIDTPTESRVERAEDLVGTLGRLARGANLVVLGAASRRFRIFTDLADRIAEQVDCPVLLVHAYDSHRRTLVGGIVERLIY